MKNGIYLLVILAGLSLAVADDALNRVGATIGGMQKAACEGIEYDRFYLSQVTGQLNIRLCKAIPPAERGALVTAAGEVVKTYLMSRKFEDDYTQWIEGMYSDNGKPDFNDPEWKKRAEGKYKEIEESYRQLNGMGQDIFALILEPQMAAYDSYEQILSNADESMITMFKQQGITLEKAKTGKKDLAAIRDLSKTNKNLATQKLARFMADSTLEMEFSNQQKNYTDALQNREQRLALNKKEKIRDFLQQFLAMSEDIDFQAELLPKGNDGKQKFANPEYERKSHTWRMLYRAGKEPVTAARDFARKWLTELEQ